MRLTAGWVASAVRGTVAAGETAQGFDGVSIDSRTVQPGALYVAIRGERFDGADFAESAVAAGAAGVMVPRGRSWDRWTRRGTPKLAPNEPGEGGRAPAVIEVDDTTAALQALGHAVRRESGAKVVAITGSAGKTTTKEITAEFLSARYQVMRNRGNLNNHIGLPLSLTELTGRPDVAVVELGMNHAGEISTLVGIAEPDVRVWTNVAEAHVGFFASVDAIADAKAEILEGATASTLLVANADDPRVTARIGSFAGRVVTFGIDAECDVRARRVVDRGIGGTSAQITTPRGTVELTTPLFGRGNLANVLAATAVAIDFGIPLPAIAERAAALRPASHRGEVVRLPDGVTVIDDSYNANPTATRRALDVLAVSNARRRVAVLGEMLELGDHAVALHEGVGRAAAGAQVDLLLTVGGAPAGAMAAAAVQAGMARERVRHFATSDEAAAAAASLVEAGDLVLVKGSRGIRADRVVDRLKAERR
jgi:UDP-N-acetylmuramoyl-tripeptide--D-alanyl-D-alanine ligase